MKIDFLKKEIWDLLRTIQVSKDTVICPVAKDYCITPLQLRILMEVNLSEDLSLNQLAKVMDMNNGNVSTICKKLEQLGYLTRERRADDERFITLKLSPEGAKILQQMERDIESKYCLLMEDVSEERLEKIVAGIKELKALIEEMNAQQRED
ncbi:MarR family winged helix-turn-helix transcriptional regulator [Trichococcus ilyis]|jgi:DNA-binding MarR family transcriptional regulator|uniref:Helix turn helix multiple antibiotic resistance protein n=1 Tax=Trichococcus ilyis TaxID=640938 RepID=A0A143YR92_9LACT|nr:MarR family transcriptional regulator [Trichococcus ilyis]CZQ95052.1 helix turn helix multiple antibiotic resistance protein [Trichococcus ilyis]SEJ08879.1 transcriptional regulator, MarR family [Trichococcus ilyis]